VRAWLQLEITETAIVDKPAGEDEHAGHHHGHAH
jgi:chaperonin GroEL